MDKTWKIANSILFAKHPKVDGGSRFDLNTSTREDFGNAPMASFNDSTRSYVVKNLNDFSDALLKLRQLRQFEQSDMKMRIGMSQQQYQSIESGGNTTILTLLRILKGLDVELILTPKLKQTGARGKLALNLAENEKNLALLTLSRLGEGPDFDIESSSSRTLNDEFKHLLDDE